LLYLLEPAQAILAETNVSQEKTLMLETASFDELKQEILKRHPHAVLVWEEAPKVGNETVEPYVAYKNGWSSALGLLTWAKDLLGNGQPYCEKEERCQDDDT
jgi:hypothetical protein